MRAYYIIIFLKQRVKSGKNHIKMLLIVKARMAEWQLFSFFSKRYTMFLKLFIAEHMYNF